MLAGENEEKQLTSQQGERHAQREVTAERPGEKKSERCSGVPKFMKLAGPEEGRMTSGWGNRGGPKRGGHGTILEPW